jgi:hypothetical protein
MAIAIVEHADLMIVLAMEHVHQLELMHEHVGLSKGGS